MSQTALTIEMLLEKGDALPTLPEIFLKVSEQLDDENSSAQEIGDTIANDPAISYKLLTMVNSAYFGLPTEISSIAQSVSLLGRFRLKQVLIGALLGDVFKGLDSESFSLQDFWVHSIRTAIIAKELAASSDHCDEPEVLFTAGLLHDVGRLILAAQMPEVFQKISERMDRKRIDIVQSELDIVGLAHTEIGAALMLKWGFPDLIWVCVKNHHRADYSGPFYNAVNVIYLANQLAPHVSPETEDEAFAILDDIPGWGKTDISPISICMACKVADYRVVEVMAALGMTE
ncbi:MAG: putative nucleotidyltransferase with HDIG domain [Gammaproteobacteria bacterium]|jgi:putative nucleotidyltransferase with HDIG domain